MANSVLMSVFAVYDVKAELYNVPFFLPKAAMAVRSFSDLVNDEQSSIHRHPSEFKLVHLGFFDTVTGAMSALEFPESLGFGTDFVKKKED